MKSWKKRLKEEFDAIVPELRTDVKNAPISVGDKVEQNGGNTAVKSRRTVISVAAVAAACLLVLITCLALLLPKKPNQFFFTIEINPAISLVSDGNGTVTDVMASNADADVILSAEGVKENMLRKNVADAATYYADCAARLGYIDLNSNRSAVRISGYGEGKNQALLNRSKSALEDYFLSKGAFAVVLAENVDKQTFCARSGIPSDAGEAMAKYIAEQNTLFSERQAKDLSLDELQTLYGNNQNLQRYITAELNRNLDKITKNAEDINHLIGLYFEIYHHEDNPASAILKGYWEVKKYYGDKIEGDFAQLVAQMDAALQRYQDDYGVEITGIFQLQSIANDYVTVSVEKIAELIADFTYEVFSGLSAELSEIMSAAGIVNESISALVKLPQSFEEYFSKSLSLLQTEYGYRLERYGELYGREREPLTREEYDGFMDDLLLQYGSLEHYWQVVKG